MQRDMVFVFRHKQTTKNGKKDENQKVDTTLYIFHLSFFILMRKFNIKWKQSNEYGTYQLVCVCVCVSYKAIPSPFAIYTTNDCSSAQMHLFIACGNHNVYMSTHTIRL